MYSMQCNMVSTCRSFCFLELLCLVEGWLSSISRFQGDLSDDFWWFGYSCVKGRVRAEATAFFKICWSSWSDITNIVTSSYIACGILIFLSKDQRSSYVWVAAAKIADKGEKRKRKLFCGVGSVGTVTVKNCLLVVLSQRFHVVNQCSTCPFRQSACATLQSCPGRPNCFFAHLMVMQLVMLVPEEVRACSS